MPPKKKKAAAADANKDGEEDDGPTIYQELVKKEVQEIEVKLDQPMPKLNNENVEFEILVMKLQDDIERYQRDNVRLGHRSVITEKLLVREKEKKHRHQEQAVIDRDRQTDQKDIMVVEHKKAVEKNEEQTVTYQQKLLTIEEEAAEKIAKLNAQIEGLKDRVEELEEFKERIQEHESERDHWESKLNAQRNKHSTQIEQIENEKVQEIEKLRKEMLLQIRAVKVNMLNLNEEQLVGTTKLTVIQNAQLTGELEYQSKQTEHLMYKNHQMTSMIRNLKRDLGDHQEVENELAKRSHFCQKVIQRYKDQIADFKEELKHLRSRDLGPGPQQRDEQDLLEYLNDRIQTYELRLKQTQLHLAAQENEYSSLLEKVWQIRSKYLQCDLLLTDFIQSMVDQDQDILNRQSDIYLDIDAIKEAGDLNELPPQSLVALCLVLRKQLQPYITELNKTKLQASFQKRVESQAAQNPLDDDQSQINEQFNQQQQALLGQRVTVSSRDDQNANLSFIKNQGSKVAMQSNMKSINEVNSTRISQHMMGSDRGTQPTINHDVQSAGNPMGLLQSQAQSIHDNYTSMKQHHPYEVDQTMSPDPNRKPQTTDRQHPYMSLRSNKLKAVGNVPALVAAPGIKNVYNSVDAEKYRMQYNSSSIPYLQRNRKQYANSIHDQPINSVQMRANLGGGGTIQHSANKYGMSPHKPNQNPYAQVNPDQSYGSGHPLLESPLTHNRRGVQDQMSTGKKDQNLYGMRPQGTPTLLPKIK